MSARPDVAALLAGPRGRRLCWELLGAPWLGSFASDATVVSFASSSEPEPSGPDDAPEPVAADQVVRQAAAEFAGADPAQAFSALAQAVGAAAYWQPPDHDDEILSSPSVAAELVPVAERLLANPATEWWGMPLALDAQRLTQFLDEPVSPREPALSDPGERLQAWRADQHRQNESFRAIREGRGPVRAEAGWTVYRDPGDGPEEEYARMSGTWWSTPNRWDVHLTARDLRGVGPVALSLTEDELGWEHAHCWPVTPVRPVRSYEITDPQSWAALVARHPLDVTDSRRPDWKWATGSDGPWLIPDWFSVAREFDAIHLTVFGYLTTAGRAIAVDDEHWTVLAGWDPDSTFWLTDALSLSGPVAAWQQDDEGEWARAAA